MNNKKVTTVLLIWTAFWESSRKKTEISFEYIYLVQRVLCRLQLFFNVITEVIDVCPEIARLVLDYQVSV